MFSWTLHKDAIKPPDCYEMRFVVKIKISQLKLDHTVWILISLFQNQYAQPFWKCPENSYQSNYESSPWSVIKPNARWLYRVKCLILPFHGVFSTFHNMQFDMSKMLIPIDMKVLPTSNRGFWQALFQLWSKFNVGRMALKIIEKKWQN